MRDVLRIRPTRDEKTLLQSNNVEGLGSNG